MDYLKIAALIAAFLAGSAAGFTTDHKLFDGRELAGARKALPGQLGEAAKMGAEAQTKTDKDAFSQWGVALSDCRRERTEARDAAAAARAQADTYTSQQSAAAFRLGRASCGGTHATPAPGPDGHNDPAGGVPDGEDDLLGVLKPAAFAPGR
jgi:hypothetical protein